MKLYEDGYSQCACFWGSKPAKLVTDALTILKAHGPTDRLKAIDYGCGEGKNSNYIAKNGIHVVGFDQSELAISHANKLWNDSSPLFLVSDMQLVNAADESYDLAVSTGSIHCLQSQLEVELMLTKIKRILKVGGLFVFSSFNDRKQDFSGHPDDFNPILLSHDFFVSKFSDFEIIHNSDRDLLDIHPHTNIEHIHSITRILARRIV